MLRRVRFRYAAFTPRFGVESRYGVIEYLRIASTCANRPDLYEWRTQTSFKLGELA